MSYQYDLPDFKRFLNSHSSKNRVDGLIFWQNRIPLPIDLFNRMFNECGTLFQLYIDHVVAALLAHELQNEIFSEFSLPCNDLPSSRLARHSKLLSDLIEARIAQNRNYEKVSLILSEYLALEDYTLQPARLVAALCHQGKKYERLFCPQKMRNEIESFFPLASASIGIANTDMFGNIVADQYDIYRSGFGDALALIFNKQMEFRLLCNGHSLGLKRVTISVAKEAGGFSVLEERTADGSLWEPDYGEAHILRLNPEHPFFQRLAAASSVDITMLKELLFSFCEFENNQFSDTQRKIIENMRQEVSRELWIRSDQKI